MSKVTIDLTNPEEKARVEREERLQVLKQQSETARLQAEAVAKELEELEATGEQRFEVEQAFKALKTADESNDSAKKDEAYGVLYLKLQNLYVAQNSLKVKKEQKAKIEEELEQQRQKRVKEAEVSVLSAEKTVHDLFSRVNTMFK